VSTSTKITYDQYVEMIRLGLFDPPEEHKVELLHGEIVPKYGDDPVSPINPPHNNGVNELTEWSFDVLPRQAARVGVQGSIAIPALQSQPEPDLVWLARRDYSKRWGTPEDVLLLIEVSDSTLHKDRGIKSRLYAQAGIRDYWIVNIVDRRIEVRRDPVGSTYRSVTIYQIGEEVRPLAFPEVALPVSRIFPD